MKKLLSGILSVTMLISMVLTSITASADSFMNIIVDSQSVKAGSTVYLKLNVTDNPGFSYMRVDVTINESAIKFVGAENGEVSTDSFTLSEKLKALSWDSENDSCENGTLAVIELHVNENTAAGEYEVGLNVKGCYNSNEDDVTINVTKGIITVEAEEVPVDGITVTPVEKTLKSKGESFTLTPIVTPDNATNKNVTFKSSDTTVAKVDKNGVVTAVSNGTATITATTEDGSKTAVCKVTVDIPHIHTMKKINAKISTCVVQGSKTYYSCEECGKYFKDEAGKTETTPDKEKLPLSDHKGGMATCEKKAVCDVCGKEYGKLATHSYASENTDAKYLKSEATCTSKAVYYYSCDVCGAIGTETFKYGEVNKNNHTGNTKIVGQKEATCYENGYTGDVVCTDCNKVIEQGKVISAGHTPSDVWSTDSESHWKECTVGCGNIIDKSAHSGGEANCHERAVCEVCGVEYGDIDSNNHDGETEVRNAVAATEDSDGYTGDTYCLECGEKIADGEVVDKLNHTHSMKKTEAVAANHTEDGNIEYYTCEKCGKIYKDADGAVEITIENTVIKALGHDYGDVYKFDAGNHWKECGCGNVIETAVHEFGEWTVVKAATATEPGSKECTCSICGYTETVEIPMMKNPDDSSVSDNSSISDSSSSSSAANNPTTASKPGTPSGNGVAKSATDKSPNTGAGTVALASGIIALGTLVLTRKKR